MPPFIPETNDATDVQNVANEFLSESISVMSTPVENQHLKQRVSDLSESLYKDFMFINSHNLILSPKRSDVVEFAFKN